MALTALIAKSFGLQNIAAWVLTRIPRAINHNVEKLIAIRNAFGYTALEGVDGDYLEFGVFEGTSLVAAVNAYHSQLDDPQNQKSTCRFFGFDSFSGLAPDTRDSAHPCFQKDALVASYDRVVRRIRPYRKRDHVELVRGYFKDTVTHETFARLGIERVRVSLIDCDLRSSAQDVFRRASQYWQAGTMLVVDDFFSYRGDVNAGVCGAFNELCHAHPEFSYRDFADFGCGGKVLVVTSPPRLTTESELAINVPRHKTAGTNTQV